MSYHVSIVHYSQMHQIAIYIEGGADLGRRYGLVNLRLAGSRQQGKVDLVGTGIFLILAHTCRQGFVVVTVYSKDTVVAVDVVGKLVQRLGREAEVHVRQHKLYD